MNTKRDTMSNYDEFNVDEVGRTRYVLGHGTSDEQFIGWPDDHRPLRGYFKSVQETLVLLRAKFLSQGGVAQVALVDGIWLNWIYCAMDVDRLNRETGLLRREIADVRSQLAAMGEVFADFGALLESGEVDEQRVGKALQVMGAALMKNAVDPVMSSGAALVRRPTRDFIDTSAKRNTKDET